jgi:hypothetical protein
MSTTWNFYADAGVTTLAEGGATVIDGLSPSDRMLYFASPAAGKTLQAASNPGVDAIVVEVFDDAVSSGAEASAIRLSLSAAGLATATPGAPLSLPATLTSGPAGAVAIYVRTEQGALALGTYTGLSLRTSALVET